MTEQKKAKGFFALDLDQFRRIDKLGYGIEEAAVYLALMKGTDQTNVISRGGVNSIMEYTGLSRSEAKRAIGNLDRAKLIEVLDVERVRAKTLPRFRLPEHESRRALSDVEAAVVAKIAAGDQPTTTAAKNTANRAAQKGWIEKLSTGWATVPASRKVAFIPNMFVHMPGHTSPFGRLMQGGDLGPVMLAAELYHKQDLMNERGVPLDDIVKFYKTTASINAGSSPSGYKLHWLKSGRDNKAGGSFDSSYWPGKFHHEKERFWDDLHALERAHIVEWAIYSANGKPKDEQGFNRPQRPLGVQRNGRHVQDTPEAAVAFGSYQLWIQSHKPSAEEFGTVEAAAKSWRELNPIVCVENAHVDHVEGVGILRMTTRAHTENTAQWLRDLRKETRESIFFLNKVQSTSFPQSPAIIEEFAHTKNSDAAIST